MSIRTHTVVALLNVGAGALRAFCPSDALQEGPTLRIEAAGPEAALEAAYSVGNRIGADAAGRHWPAQVRSLSMGDLLLVDGAPFSVAALGFDPVRPADLAAAQATGLRHPALWDLDLDAWRAEWPADPR